MFGSKRLLGVCCFLGIGACTKPTVVLDEIPGGQPCEAGEECAVGFVCVEELCRAVCNRTRDCKNDNEVCTEGVCSPLGTPDCMSDADCVEPPPCRVASGATCASGTCVFPIAPAGSVCDDGTVCTVDGTERCDLMGNCVGEVVICDDPPPSECLQDDTVFRDYEDIGSCHPVNGCEYEGIDIDCPNCIVDCLRPCEGVTCDELEGGCRDDGFCVPTATGPDCQYNVIADDGDFCYREQDTDEPLGVCLSGECVDCLVRQDCIDAPGVLTCYDATCSALSECEYVLVEDRVCMAATCADGYVNYERLCGAAGDCPSAGGYSCGAYACAPDAQSCLLSCAGDGDCAVGSFCDSNACVTQAADGEVCDPILTGRDCASGHCQNGYCCTGATADCCAGDSDCDPWDTTGTCIDATNCQGRRQDFSCVGYVCTGAAVDDDSPCAGYVGNTCGTFADYLCTNETDQSPPSCLSDCLTGGVADDDKCDSGLVCQQSTGTCQAPAGLGDCCLHAACGMAPCTGSLHCGDTQSPPAYVCCAPGSRCCSVDGDCTGGYRCNSVLAECYDSCANEDDSKCVAAYHCEVDTCVSDRPDGDPCVENSDCANGSCRNNVCCAPGLICCSDDTPCGVYACDTTTTHACFSACTGEDDSRCSPGAHCDAGICYADQGIGVLCDEDGDCLSGNCADDFDSTSAYCAPAGECARGATSYPIGYSLCSADSYLKSCVSEGTWGAQQDSPDSADDYCDAGGGFGSGYDLAATCASGPSGSFSDPTCTSCEPFAASSPSSCFTSCASNDDGKCWPGLHCNAANLCVADLADGAVCVEDSDCQSFNCSDDFSTANKYCAPPNTCADGASSHPVGYALCSGNSYYRSCQTQGSWGPIQNSPQATSVFCDAGGGSQTGYDPAATCTSGTAGGFSDSGCTSCGPYKAATTTSCFTDCATNDDNKCWATSHCSATNTCVTDIENGTACVEDSDCSTGNCSQDFDSSTRFCAPANMCADDASFYDVGYELCDGDTSFKSCTAEGAWGSSQPSPQATAVFCDAGGGPESGYDPAATCSSGMAGGFTDQSCIGCSPYNANTTSSCYTNCATEDDSRCWTSMHCEGSTCVGDLTNGQICANGIDCLSGNCSEDFDSGTRFCAPANMCADNNSFYDIGYELCSGNSYYKTCTAEGDWDSQHNNPDPTNDYCDAGGGAQSGFDLAATCNSGLTGGFSNPTCTSCSPYSAATTSTCNTSCAVNDDSKCWSSHHCDASNLCALDIANGSICYEATDCVSGNCSDDFDSSNMYCAPANTCADNATTYNVGYELCSGDAFYRSCTGSGTWAAPQNNPQPTAAYCDAGGGAQSGYDPPATCASGTSGGFNNPACVSCTPYRASSTSTCYVNCNTDDDSKCWSTHHCNASNACVADFSNGTVCTDDSDCTSGNCSDDFDSATDYCAPSNTCANNTSTYLVGYELCSGNAYYKSCAAEGSWGPQQDSPQATAVYCDAGGGAQSGYDPAATCTSGSTGGFSNAGCSSCSPYMANSTTSCYGSCASNDDTKCWAAYHCNASNLCTVDLGNGTVCLEDSDCTSGNCSDDFDSATDYCAPTGSCANNSASYAIGYELCSGDSYFKSCSGEGTWGGQQNSPDADDDYCNAGGGANSGYDLAATCASGTSGGFTDPTCTACNPYIANSTSSCYTACSSDAQCWSGVTCSAPTCVGGLANGAVCSVDGDCQSNNCSADFDSGTRYCAPPSTCADDTNSYAVGYELCSGDNYFRSCTSEGVWGTQQNNPQLTAAYCDAGGGSQSGYDPPATCSSGTSGGFSNPTCVSCSPYRANSTSSCYSSCATNDDGKCWTTHHCDASNVCAPDLGNGQVCLENSDCSSDNCSDDFATASSYCAPAGQCASGANSYSVGYELCNGDSYYKTCASEGLWGSQQDNPQPSPSYCDAGGGGNSGYDPPASCTSGSSGGFSNPSCVSCTPYMANSTSSCFSSCASNDDGKCWAAFHCSGSDTCVADFGNGTSCAEDSDCTSNNCSADFDSTSSYCAPGGTCANNASSYAIGYELCSGDSYYKTCSSEGIWGGQQSNPQSAASYCDAGGGAQSGYDPAATCSSGASGGFTNPGCSSCSPYMAASTTACRTSCTLETHCWPVAHCDTNACVADGANGDPCTDDGDCTSGNCSEDFDSSSRYCAPAGTCANNSSSYAIGFELCSGNAYYKSCIAEGDWGTQQNSPQSTPAYCDAGGGAQSGFDPAATCASGSSGGFSNPGCTSCSPYMAASTSSCHSDCAANDDGKCWSAFHCNAANACTADLTNGSVCLEDSDCTSDNCSEDFDSATDYCATAGSCANNGASYAVGYELCSGNSWYKSCLAEGDWGSQQNTPQGTAAYCDAGDGAQSGYDPAATCSSGTTGGFSNPGCTSCAPYMANSTSSCYPSCATNDDAKCWSAYHCGSSNTCVGDLSNGAVCLEDSDCATDNCSEDFNSSTLYCAVAGRCANNSASYVVGYELCSGNTYYKTCSSEGNWGAQQNNPQPTSSYCNAGGGSTSGYDPAAVCASGTSGGFSNPGCTSCSPYMANSTSSCYTSCASNDDAKCWSAFHCSASDSCTADFGNGALCIEDSDCGSANCSQDLDSSSHYCAPANQCANNASFYNTNWSQCVGDSYYKTCTAEGVWGTTVNNPDPTDNYCNAGGGSTSGYDLSASCVSGSPGSFNNPGCTSCSPYLASSPSGCYSSCATNDDSKCWPPRVCYQAGGNTCVTYNTYCDSDEDCDTSWYTCIDNWCWSSCPYIFARRNDGWEHVTDDAGNAFGMMKRHALKTGLSKWFGPNYIVLGDLDRDPDGFYRVKLRETLNEIDFIDELKLVAIDHPAGTEAISSSAERRIEDRKYFPPEVYTVRDPRPLLAATDWLGRDVLAEAVALDGVPVPSDPARPQWYEFDFGYIDDTRHAKLVLDAWSMFGNLYVSKKRVRAHLSVVDKNGEWVRVRDIGFPAGDKKRQAIDISNLFLSDDHRIRIHTGTGPGKRARWTIDRARLDTSAPEETVVREVEASYAALGHKGAIPHLPANFEHRILADDSSVPSQPRSLGLGDFTRFGRVDTLLDTQDLKYVIMQHGDELVLSFEDPGDPAPGMVRTWALRSTLMYKQFYREKTVEPYPVWGMTQDPPPPGQEYPTDPEHNEYRAAYNTRTYVIDTVRDGGVVTRRRSDVYTLATSVEDHTGSFTTAELEELDATWKTSLEMEGRFRLVPQTHVNSRRAYGQIPEKCTTQACRVQLSASLGSPAAIGLVIAGVGDYCSVTAQLDDVASSSVELAATVDSGCSTDDVARALIELAGSLEPPASRGLACVNSQCR